MTRRIVTPAIVGVLIAASACGDDGTSPTDSDTIANASYLSEATADGRVTLVDGSFEFPPGNPVERVELVDFGTGDLDGDEETDAVVVLVETSGRTQLFRVHAMRSDGDRLEDIAVRLVGDRLEVRAVRIDEGIVELDLLVRGPGQNSEAPPTFPATNRFVLTDRGLIQIDPPSVREAGPRALQAGGVATLASHEWLLERIDVGDWSQETDILERRPTLRFVKELGDESTGSGRLYGDAGCNRMFGSYVRGADGSLRISGLAATRRACRDPEASLEARVMSSLGAARAVSIAEDALTIDFDGGTLRFRAGGELIPPDPPSTGTEGEGEQEESGRRT